MIKRNKLIEQVKKAFTHGRIVALLGPRQCGKTTLARCFLNPGSPSYFDLEDPRSLARLSEPMDMLSRMKGIVVIDEIQRAPELFPILRVLADRTPLPAKFLILGSTSPELIRHSSESLAGRLSHISINGFSLEETGLKNSEKLWLRGGLPRSFLASSEKASYAWRQDYLRSFVERDLPALGVALPAATLSRFWMMLAHYHGQTLNVSELARSMGISEITVRRYIDIMSGAFIIRQVHPWFTNLKKRQVKAPKIYICDSGLLHALFGIQNMSELMSHPKYGASWEGFILEEVIKSVHPDEFYFWATHNGAEIDLVFKKNGKMYGVEVKRADAPQITPSMKTALTDLNLSRIAVVYPGNHPYPLNDKIEVVPASRIVGGMKTLFY